jgi:hypothetical protein
LAPGYRANPSGKPKGTRHRATMLAEKLFDKDAAKIVRKVVAAAQAGEPWAAKLVIERIIPRPATGRRRSNCRRSTARPICRKRSRWRSTRQPSDRMAALERNMQRRQLGEARRA